MNRLFNILADVVTSLNRTQKVSILIATDTILVPVSVIIATQLFGMSALQVIWQAPIYVLIMTFAGVAASVAVGLPRVKLNSYEQSGIQRTAAYGVVVGLSGIIALAITPNSLLNTSLMIFSAMTLIILSVSVRLMLRNLLLAFYHRSHIRQRVLIYGAGQTGVQLATALRTDDAVEPVAFIDDNQTLQKVLVAGLPVHPPARVQKIVEDMSVDRVVLAMPSLSRPKQARLARHLESLGCEVASLPSFASLVGEGKLSDRIQPVNPSDYLGRSGLDNELDGGCDIYTGGCVMITGAGGSIGSELARQVLVCAPSKIVLFEVSEYALYQVDRELNELKPQGAACEIVPILGTVTDERLVQRVMARHSVDTVLHAAAYKHVNMVEKNRSTGLYNNVFGTRAVVRAARAASVKNFILVSTDKAVNPKNVMGASKRLSEIVVQDAASRSDTTRFGIVRFGNVLGSSGSVVPLFEEQISRGGPVTLTHNEVTRYFMTISEAARLVLLVGSQAHLQDEQGEVYVLDMGAPVQIKKLARQMIESAGYTVCDRNNPNGDIEIVITGLRPGEKMHEELADRNRKVEKTTHPKINRIEEEYLSEIETATAMRALSEALEKDDDEDTLAVLKRWVGSGATHKPVRTMTIENEPVVR